MKKEVENLKEALEAERASKDEKQTALEFAEEVASTADEERHQLEETHRQYVEQKEEELNQLKFEAVQAAVKFEEEVKQLKEELATVQEREEELKKELARCSATWRWKMAFQAVKATRRSDLSASAQRSAYEEAYEVCDAWEKESEEAKQKVGELQAAANMWNKRAEAASKMVDDETMENQAMP
jgi:hypothetical protein